jgi:malic enzyme
MTEHLDEMLPIVYTPTGGTGMRRIRCWANSVVGAPKTDYDHRRGGGGVRPVGRDNPGSEPTAADDQPAHRVSRGRDRVAQAAENEDLARRPLDDLVQQVHQATWRPQYPSFEAI